MRVRDSHELIGNPLDVRQPQEIAQRERVRATPRDAPLAVDALEVADHVHAWKYRPGGSDGAPIRGA